MDEFSAALPSPAAGERAYCIALCRALGERFAHGAGRFTFATSWPAWALSLVYPVSGVIEDPDDLFRYSDRALCDQIAQAFVQIATRAGLRARLVQVGGAHVVAEAHYE